MSKVYLLILWFCFLNLLAGGQLPVITINSITPAQAGYCVGDSITIHFATSNFTGTNNFNAGMSKSGFSLDSTNIGSIGIFGNPTNATLFYILRDQDADPDSAYQIRIRSGAVASALYPPAPFSISPTPVGSVSAITQFVCSGSSFITISLGTSNNIANTTFSWTRSDTVDVSGPTSGNGDISGSVLINNTLSNRTVIYTIIPTGPAPSFCRGDPFISTVVVKPVPVMTSIQADTICSGGILNIPLTSNLPSNYLWFADDNPNTYGQDTIPNVSNSLIDTIFNGDILAQLVIYTVIPSSSIGNCLGDPQFFLVTVNPAVFATNDTVAGYCSSSRVSIPLSANIPSHFTWKAVSNLNITGESTTLQNSDTLLNTLSNSTTAVQTVVYTITPTSVAGGCQGISSSMAISVYPVPPGTFSILSVVSACERGNIYNFAAAQNINITSYNWTFGSSLSPASDTGSAVTESFTGTGDSIPVKLLIHTAYGCSDSSQRIINIYPSPDAAFTVSDSTPCSGDTLQFVRNSIDTANSLIWIWGDGTANFTCTGCANASHKYTSAVFPSLRTAKLIAVTGHGCRDTVITHISVKPYPHAVFTIDDNTQCLSNGNNLFTFTDNSTVPDTSGNHLNYLWDFSDNSLLELSKNAVHSYAGSDSYFVYHAVTTGFGCSDSVFKLVVIYPDPPFQIMNSAGADTLCDGMTVTLAADSGFHYQWSTNVTTQSITFINNVSGAPYTVNYEVTVSDNHDCSSTGTKSISVIPSPSVPQIVYDSSLIYCAGARAQLFKIANTESVAYTWTSVPDYASLGGFAGSKVNIDLPNTPGGVFTIYVTAAENIIGCSRSDTVSISISANTAPTGAIVRDFFTLICTNNTVSAYQWGYDDADLLEHLLSGETNQSYDYGSNPDYSLSGKYFWVRITDEGGCESKIYYQAPPLYFTSVHNLKSGNIALKVFPNPLWQLLTVNARCSGIIEVVNANGQPIFEKAFSDELIIDSNRWSAGVYLVKVISETGEWISQRVVKF